MNKFEQARKLLQQAFQEDPEMYHVYHANISMCIHDAVFSFMNLNMSTFNHTATRVLDQILDVKHPKYLPAKQDVVSSSQSDYTDAYNRAMNILN